MKLCTSCWKDKCECERGEYVEIDDEMVDIIVELNRKGYVTRNCCAGHMEYFDGIPQPMNTYVQFHTVYPMPELPKEFILEKQETEDGIVTGIMRSVELEFDKDNGYFFLDKEHKYNQMELDAARVDSINGLKDWVHQLKNVKVVTNR